MLTKQKIRGLCFCRDCLNMCYGLNLTKGDVKVFYSLDTCKRCGRVRHIVADVSKRKFLQLLTAKRTGI